MNVAIRTLDAAAADAAVPALAALLIACVEGGASVSFMAPLDAQRAEAFWIGVAQAVAARQTHLLVAKAEGALLGTVQLCLAPQENQPHRADVAKMLVSPQARRRGIGRALLAAAEAEALRIGRTLLVLDSVTGGAGTALYAACGWTRVGDVPDYALYPDGRPCGTTFFYRNLATRP